MKNLNAHIKLPFEIALILSSLLMGSCSSPRQSTLSRNPAEAKDPEIGKQMHAMSNAIDCLQHKLPASLCEADESVDVTYFQEGATNARRLFDQKFSSDAQGKASIDGFFDELDVLLQKLKAAVASKDSAGKMATLTEINVLKKKAHLAIK